MNQLGKRLAGPLSRVVASSATADVARLLEAYWAILLGKGAGTGWALRAEVTSAMSVIASPNPIIFDVGANCGQWSLDLNSLIPGARFFLFEPQPECQRLLQGCGVPNFELIAKAVSSGAGRTDMFSNGSTSGIASLHPRRDSYFEESSFRRFEVDTVTLDEVIAEYKLQFVDFMKMDIEGHELRALEGARASLEKGVVKAMTFEFGSGNVNSRTFFRDYWDYLSPLDYKIYRILPSARLLPIDKYYEDCEHFRGVTNYLAVLGR